jgi:hypothetical protein
MDVLTQLLANLGPREVQDSAHKRSERLVLSQVLALGEFDERALALLHDLPETGNAEESGACGTENRSVHGVGEIEMGGDCLELSNRHRWSGCSLCSRWIKGFSAMDCSVEDRIEAKPPYTMDLVPGPNSGEILRNGVPGYRTRETQDPSVQGVVISWQCAEPIAAKRVRFESVKTCAIRLASSVSERLHGNPGSALMIGGNS